MPPRRRRQRRVLLRRASVASSYTFPSPSLGPPLLSESPSPPPFWGIPPSAGGSAFGAGAGFGAGFGAGLGAGLGAAGSGAGLGAGASAFGAGAGAAGLGRDGAFELDACPARSPAGVTANHEPPNATTPWPLVWPGLVSMMNRY